MKKIYLTILSLLLCHFLMAQVSRQVLSPAGSSFVGSSFSVHHTLGQITTTSGNGLRQGFNQPPQNGIPTQNPVKNTEIVRLNIYPNPFVDEVSFNFTEEKNTSIELEIFDVLGNLVYTTKTTNSTLKIESKDFASGYYFYKCTAKQGKLEEIKTGKIFKS
jgi:hypothetical protein